MAEQLTLDDVARMTSLQAVRVRFDAHNLLWLRFLAFAALIAGVPGLIVALVTRSWLSAALIVVSFVATFLAFRATRRGSRSRFAAIVGSSVTAYATAWCVLQTLLCVFVSAHSDGLIACAVVLPFAAIGFRMLPSELLTLHLLMAIVASGSALFAPPSVGPAPALIFSAVFINGTMFAVELLLSRRWKREIVSDWDERRHNAQEQVRMRDELHYAREVQLSMLPEAPPVLEWLDVAGLSLPASEVGGDYYDYLAVDDALVIVTGDVAGHGLASGIVLAALRGGFTLLRDQLRQPAAVLERLHELVAQTSRRRMLVTCAVILLDPQRRRATIASAGHPPLLVRRVDGSVERLELFAPPLGVRLPLHIASTDVPFATGDVFVLHSDGVYESRNAAGDTYGFERLERLVAAADGAPARDICDAIARDLELFRGNVAQDDDVTVVVARIA